MLHELKTDEMVFNGVLHGIITFNIRKDDRGYKVGNILHLRKTKSTGAEMAAGAPLEYTGNEYDVTVTHILVGPIYGLVEGWVIMSIRPSTETDKLMLLK